MMPTVPGIYVSEQQYTLNPLHIQTDCITAFAGITEKGVLNTPVTIRSFDAFLHHFGGFDTAGVLPLCVYSYFKCGGNECVIVRIADTKEARKANVHLRAQKGTVTLEAKTEGKWGNYLSCRVWHEGETLGDVSDADYEKGEWIAVSDEKAQDIRKNDTIKCSLIGRIVYRTVKHIEGNRIYLTESIKALCHISHRHNQNDNETITIKAEKAFFSLSLFCKDKRETYLHLSANPHSDRYFLSYINERSALCTVYAEENTGIIHHVFSQQASGGNDGIANISPKDFIGYYNEPHKHAGIACFESREDISLIACPDVQWLLSGAGKTAEQKMADVHAVQTTLITQAERFPGRFAILDVPTQLSITEAAQWAQKIDSEYAAAYYPSIDVLDPLDPLGARSARIPPSGSVCGCIAATDSQKGIFYAPANMLIQGAVGISQHINDQEYEILYPKGINMLKYFPGRGIKVWGARTLSSNPDWRYINVRRTFSRIADSIKRGTHWAVFEPNDKNLRKRLVRHVSGFLLNLWMKGYLAGSTAEQGFYVRCDEELNPGENIDAGILSFEVGIAIIKPIEFFRIHITAEKDGASVYIQE